MMTVDNILPLLEIRRLLFRSARTTSQQNACINNLRQIDGAIQQWALENKKDSSATVAYTDISGYLKNAVTCPSGGTRSEERRVGKEGTSRSARKKDERKHAMT